LIEGLSGSGQPVSGGSSPGLHGKIEVRIGDQTIGSYLVTDNPLTIGRDPAQALVVIEEPIISKLHCQVFARAGLVFVKDLHSTNGVYVNEEKIGERELRDGDEFFLGRKGTVRIAYHR
jgi:pSer/pThr/pTyr-binding forkhead associated (FHA) protein